MAKSSRAGMKRKVKARPAMRRPCATASGFGPAMATRRKPFFSSTVVMVAVDMPRSAAIRVDSSVMLKPVGNSAVNLAQPRR